MKKRPLCPAPQSPPGTALLGEGSLKAGDTVLVLGTGGVSIFAPQFAHLQGARVIVTSSSDEKLKRASEMGASDGINYANTPKWDAHVRELTGGRGVDYVVEVGGAGTLTQSMKCVRAGGQISLIGVLSGGTGQINPLPILMRNIRVQGIFVGSREMFEAMNLAITLAKLKPVVDKVFDFKDAVAAYEYMEQGKHFGKVVVRPTRRSGTACLTGKLGNARRSMKPRQNHHSKRHRHRVLCRWLGLRHRQSQGRLEDGPVEILPRQRQPEGRRQVRAW